MAEPSTVLPPRGRKEVLKVQEENEQLKAQIRLLEYKNALLIDMVLS